MSERKIAIRIGVTGREEVKRAFAETGAAGEAAFAKTAMAIDAAGAASDRTTARLQRLGQAARQAVDAERAQQSFNAVLGITAPVKGTARASAEFFEAELGRIEEVARLRAQQIGGEFQRSLNASFRIGDTVVSARDSAAIFEAELDRVEEVARLKAQQIGAAFQQSLNASFRIGGNFKPARESAAVFEEEARAIADVEARTRALRAQIDPLRAAQDRLNAELAEANALYKAGAISVRENAAAHGLAQQRFRTTAASLKTVGEGGQLAAHQLTSLSFQVNDVVTMLALGSSRFQVLASQGGQVYQILSSAPGGVGGALKDIASRLGGMLTPARLATGGLLAIGAAAATSSYAWIRAEKEIDVVLGGIGRGAGITRDQLVAIADASAEVARLSSSATREIVVEYVRTGRIGAAMAGDLAALTKDYAATTNQDITDAAAELSQAFADPARGADLLNAKLGFLDDRTLQYIRTLSNQNDRTGAQRALLDALRPSLIDAAESTTALGRAWDWTARQAENAFDWMGRAISRATEGPGVEDQLTALRSERAQLGLAAEEPPFSGDLPKGYLLRGGSNSEMAKRRLAEIDAEIAKLQGHASAVATQVRQSAAEAEAVRQSTTAGEISRSVTQGYNELERLKTQQAALSAALANPMARAKLADLHQTEAAYDAVSRAITSYLTPAEKARRLDELEIRSLNARSPSQRAAVAEERRRIELSGQVVTSAEAEADANRAGQKALASATQGIADQSAALTVNARATLDVAEAWLKGGTAALEADARRQALTQSLRDGASIDLRMREILAEQVADEAAQAAKSASGMNEQAAAQRRVNEAVAAGLISTGEAQRDLQAEQALRPLITLQTIAEGDAKATLAKVIDCLRDAYGRLNAEESRSAALQQLETQRDQIVLLQRQIDLAGSSESYRAVELAQLQARQQLIQRGIALASEEGQAIIANAALLERLGQDLTRAQAGTQVLVGLADSTFNRFADLIAEGKTDWASWADAGRAAIMDITREMLKLALFNPIKNVLFGQNNPTLGDIGGLFGSLFGGSTGFRLPDGSAIRTDLPSFQLPARRMHGGGNVGVDGNVLWADPGLFRNARRMHSGGQFLSPDEVPTILQTGERVLNRAETRAYNRRQGGDRILVPVTIQATNPAAFAASKGQIASTLTRAVRAGVTGL